MNRQVVRVLATIFCVFAAQTYVFVLIPLTAVGLGMPGVLIGVLVGVPAGIGLASDVLVAVVSDAIGRRAPIVLGAALGVAASVVLAVATDFLTLLVGGLLFGLSMSLCIGPALAYVTEASTHADHARIQGYNGGVQGLSALGGALLVGVAVDRLGPQASALLGAFLMAMALVLAYRLSETVGRVPAPRSARTLLGAYASALRMLATRPPLQLASLVSLIYGSVVFVVGNAFLPVYIVRDLGESAVLVGALLGARNVATTLVSPLYGYVAARFGLIPTMFGTCVIAVLGVMLMPLSETPALLFLALILQGVGIAFTPATCNLLVTSATARRERALGFATNSLASRGGTLLSPLLFGAILQIAGMHAVFFAAGLLGIAYLIAMTARVASITPAVLAVRGGASLTDDPLR